MRLICWLTLFFPILCLVATNPAVASEQKNLSDESALNSVCQRISEWKPGEPGPTPAEYQGQMQIVDMDFIANSWGQKNLILVDSRGDKEREKGLFTEALSLRSGLRSDEPDDYEKNSILAKMALFLSRPNLSWNEVSQKNFVIFCNGEKCPKSARAGCALRKLGIAAKQIHVLPLSYDQLFSSGLSLHMQGSKLVSPVQKQKSLTEVHVLRLRPGMDLKKSLSTFQKFRKIQAGSIVSAVGSLNLAQLRFANQKEATSLKGPFEIVSLSGTLGSAGMHLHMSISDKEGKTLGGHLVDGNLIYTTAEITILEAKNFRFGKEKDELSTYDELVISSF